MKIKICGLTRKIDVDFCCKIGVDALGFILARSPRQISLNQARKLTNGIPPFISRVAVVVNPSFEKLGQIIESRFFDYIQFHGDEESDMIKEIPLRSIKAISIGEDIEEIKNKLDRYQVADYFLFDTKSCSKRGGTGKVFDWSLIEKLGCNKPFIMAGGLEHGNIEDVLKNTEMSGVDLNSKLESSPGIKNHLLIKKTVLKIKDYCKNKVEKGCE